MSSNHYSKLKKQVKVDPETRSYDFLTKTREKNPMYRNIRDPGVTLENAMIIKHVKDIPVWQKEVLITSVGSAFL